MQQEERRTGERRGRGFSKSHGLNEFIHNFWRHYFHDRPDLERRKQVDRRGNSESQKSRSAWERFGSWFRKFQPRTE